MIASYLWTLLGLTAASLYLLGFFVLSTHDRCAELSRSVRLSWPFVVAVGLVWASIFWVEKRFGKRASVGVILALFVSASAWQGYIFWELYK